MRSPETVPENQDIIKLGEELESLQAKENQGRGVSCVRTAVTYLKMGKLEEARRVCHVDHDKIVSYPELKEWIKENLFKGVEDHPWRFLDSMNK